MTQSQDRIIASLTTVAREGAMRAGRGLSGLMGQEVTIHVPRVRLSTSHDVCDAVGGPESLVLGAYLTISGDITGHVMLIFPCKRALECVDLMCGLPRGTTVEVDEMADSAIAELGNIVGSAFVNALADHINLILHPSPPTVVNDMAFALVEAVYAEVLAQGGDAAMIDTEIEDGRGHVAGILIVAPDALALPRLEGLAA
jgi:chemotaxis protein CheC